MRKLMAVGILLGAVLLWGCAREENKYGLILNCNTPYYEAVAKGFTEAALLNGSQALIEMPDEMSIDRQYQMLLDMRQKSLKGLAISANSPSSLNEILSGYEEEGIPVVAVDSSVNTADITLEVLAADNRKTARQLLEKASEYLGGEGQFAVISTTSQEANAEGMIKEIRAQLEAGNYPGLLLTEVAYGNNDKERCREKTRHLHRTYPDLKMILTLSSQATVGAAEFIEDSDNEESLKAAGFGLPEELEGHGRSVPFYYTYNPEELGKLAFHILSQGTDTKYVKGEKLEIDGMAQYTVMEYGNVYWLKERTTDSYPCIFMTDEVEWKETDLKY